ncbi:hypothetical protein WMF30_52730 [Sorangium sp. So ce134]
MAPRTTTKKTKKKRPSPTPKPSSTRPARPPSTHEVADMLGVTRSTPLKPEQLARLRKALPGYAGILDDVAALLEEDAGALNLPDVIPEALLATQAEQKHLAAREAVAQAVYRSLFEQRLQVDDRAMKMLEKIARRINALKEDDGDLPARGKLLLDFLGTFRQGGARKPRSAGAVVAEPVPAGPGPRRPRRHRVTRPVTRPGFPPSPSCRSRSARPVRWRILGVWPVPPRSRTSLPSPA